MKLGKIYQVYYGTLVEPNRKYAPKEVKCEMACMKKTKVFKFPSYFDDDVPGIYFSFTKIGLISTDPLAIPGRSKREIGKKNFTLNYIFPIEPDF